MAISVNSVTDAVVQGAKAVANGVLWLGRNIVQITKCAWGVVKAGVLKIANAIKGLWNGGSAVTRSLAMSSPMAMLGSAGAGIIAAVIGARSKNPVVRYGLLSVGLVAAAYAGGAAVAGGFVPLTLFAL